MSEHPMQPTDEQLAKWESDWFSERENADVLLIQAFQAGADAELDRWKEWIEDVDCDEPQEGRERFLASRRPKAPSLRRQALDELTAWTEMRNGPGESLLCDGLSVATIRRALEALPDD